MNALASSVLSCPLLEANITCGGRDQIDGIAEAWRRLFDEGRQSPLCPPEWVAAYLDALCGFARVMLLTVEIGATPVGVLPLVEENTFSGIPVRTLQTPGQFRWAARYPLVESLRRKFVSSTD
jgi:CelD/BcsL family acetyltransferase involved in cellulose biosynthesis